MESHERDQMAQVFAALARPGSAVANIGLEDFRAVMVEVTSDAKGRKLLELLLTSDRLAAHAQAKRKRGEPTTESTLPEDAFYAQQLKLVQPDKFVRSVLRRRKKLALNSTVAPEKQPEVTDVWGLCEEYDEGMFEEMDDDFNRNAAYARAFAAVPADQTRWLEIGCGADATLTKIALANGPAGAHITAFEVNVESAAAAVSSVRKLYGDRVNVVVGRSTDHELLPPPSQRFDVVLHEVFGVFSSSEGCVQMLHHGSEHYLAPRPPLLADPPPSGYASASARPRVRALMSTRELCRSQNALEQMLFGRAKRRQQRARPSPRQAGALPVSHSRCIPARSGTFFTPCELTAADLDGCEIVCIDSLKGPKALLVPCAPMDTLSLTASSAVLDMQDFGGRVAEKRETGATEAVQWREHTFAFTRDGVLNAFGIFIWVDLGIGAPADLPEGVADARDDSPAPEDCPEGCPAQDAAFPHRFPFGAGAGAGKAAARLAASGARLNDFTSLCTPMTIREQTHATNWQNPLLLLPQPVAVRAGERLHVRSCSSADSDRPSYAFELTHLPEPGAGTTDTAAGTALGSLVIEFKDIYPFYDS